MLAAVVAEPRGRAYDEAVTMASRGREPVLLVGALPRGGNHLVRGLLDSHPQLLVPPDEDFFVRQLLRRRLAQLRGGVRSAARAPAFYRALQKHGHLERVNGGVARNTSGTEDVLDLESYYAYVRKHHRRWSVDAMIRTHLGALRAALTRAQPGPDRALVHFCALQPAGGDIARIGRRLSALYDLKGIFVFRDPRAHLGSKLRRKAGVDIELFCHQQNAYWREVDRFEVLYGPALRVRFEALIVDTERTMRAVCAFAGITYREVLTRFTQNGCLTWSNSSYGRAHGIDRGALDRYREAVSPEQIRYVERRCRRELFWEEGGTAPAMGE